VRTHRLGGWLFLFLGMAFVVDGLTARRWAAGWIVGLALAMVVALFAYSYFVWRGDPPAGTEPGNRPASGQVHR
jgi:immunity protein, SdpI family